MNPAARKVYRNYRRHAMRRNLEWGLSETEFWHIARKKCHFCGALRPQTARQHKHAAAYTGVDRWDSTVGYVRDNVVPCCWSCNAMKGALNGLEFLQKVGKIVSNSLKRAA